MAKPLAERIASARSTDRVTVTNLREIIAEAEAEMERLTALAVQATSDSLNFAISEDDREASADKAARALRSAKALAPEVEDLKAKLDAKLQADSRRAADAQRAEIIARRDALADRLRMVWPEIERSAVDLLAEIEASDAEMRAAGIHEASAEAIARGCDGNFRQGVSAVRRLVEIKLPSFADGSRLSWPVERSDFAPRIAVDQAEIRRTQMAASAAAEERERLAWAPYTVQATRSVKAHWTEITAKRSPNEEFPGPVHYYAPLAADTGEAPRMQLWMKPAEASWLRGNGFAVEAIDLEVSA